jgi:hypothetical protein
MRSFLPWLVAPLVLLAMFAIHLLVRFSLARWRLSLLTVAATLIAALPAGAETDPGPTCYDMSIEIPAQPVVKESAAWANYRAAYLSLIQYLVNNGISDAINSHSQQFTQLRMNLQKAENELEVYVNEQDSIDMTVPLITDGINFFIQDNQQMDIGVTCYGAYEITPEIRRHDDLSHIVARQVELQRMISEKKDVPEETLGFIKEDMRQSISRYLNADDAALYMDLMLDLISYVPATSKIMCYK